MTVLRKGRHGSADVEPGLREVAREPRRNRRCTVLSPTSAITSGSCCGSSEPRKLVGALPNGSECASCSIIVNFINSIPQEVTLDVTDPDVGQRVLFEGNQGLLFEHVLNGTNSNISETVSFASANGIRRVILITRQNVGIGLDDLQYSNPVPEPSTALLLVCGLAVFGMRRRFQTTTILRRV